MVEGGDGGKYVDAKRLAMGTAATGASGLGVDVVEEGVAAVWVSALALVTSTDDDVSPLTGAHRPGLD